MVAGNIAALGAVVQLQTDGPMLPSVGSVAVKVTGNWTGTLVFEVTVDGNNFDPVVATPLASNGGPVITSTTANGLWGVSIFGYQAFRVRSSAWTSGTAVVSVDGTTAALPTQPLASISVLGSNQGGPPLSSGISISTGAAGSNATAGQDPARNFQGQGYAQMQLLPTNPGDTTLVFIDNPWTSGLDLSNTILLSGGVNGAAREEVIVSLNNNPSAGAGPTTVNLQSPVVFSGSTAATFDTFALNGPQNAGATVMGTATEMVMLYDAYASDPKRPLKPWNQAQSNPGMGGVVTQPDLMGGSDESKMRQYLSAILYEMRVTNTLLAQLKDGGSMEIPVNWSGLSADIN